MYLHVEINELIRKPHISFSYILFESPPLLYSTSTRVVVDIVAG